MPNKIYTFGHAPTRYGSLCEYDDMVREAIAKRVDDKITRDLVNFITLYNESHTYPNSVMPAILRTGQGVVYAETESMDAVEIDWYDSDGQTNLHEPFGFTIAHARDAINQMYDRIMTHGAFDDLIYTANLGRQAYFIMPEPTSVEPGSSVRGDIAKFYLQFLDESEVFVTELNNNDDTLKSLTEYCDSIVADLNGGYRETVCDELGYTRNEDGDWVDTDGNELELDSNGYPELYDGSYASKYLSDCYDIKVIVDLHDTSNVYGARILVAGGGPTIYIDTSENKVEGYWGSTEVVRYYTDNIGLDEEIQYMAESFIG